VDADVRAIGAANYMTIRDGRLIGHNNDGKGVVKAILKATPIAGKRVVIMGAGGAGRAMAVELGWAGASHLTVVTRREEQGREVAAIRSELLLLIGFVDTFGKVLLPQAAGVLVYVMMALILLWKPDGLFKAG
jgi:shikimate dehydrogenase